MKDAEHADIATLRSERAEICAALELLRMQAAQLGDFMYSPVREASQDMLNTIGPLIARLSADSEPSGKVEAVKGKPRCAKCGGPHPFDTSVPSVRWNVVIRESGLPDFLCFTCILRAFASAGESFTATLWGNVFNGLPIEVRVHGQNAKDATRISEENTALRARIRELESADSEAGKEPALAVAGTKDHPAIYRTDTGKLVSGKPSFEERYGPWICAGCGYAHMLGEPCPEPKGDSGTEQGEERRG